MRVGREATQLARSTSDPTPVASASQAQAARDVQEKKTGSVFVDEGTLTFPDLGPEAPKSAQLQRAKKMLEIARSEVESKLTFGGRVSNSGIDPVRSLKNYYPSLQAAKSLAASDGGAFHDALGGFVKDVSVPADLRRLVESAVGFDRKPKASPSAPLGKVSMSQQGLQPQHFHQYARQGKPEQLALDDETVKALLPGQWWSTLDQLQNEHFTAEVMQAQIRLFARAAELGVYAQPPINWEALLFKMPNTDSARSDVLRLATALKVVPSALQFHGAPLTGPAGRPRTAMAEPAAALGGTKLEVDAALHALEGFDLSKLATLDDESVLALMSSVVYLNQSAHMINHVNAMNSDEAAKFAAVRLLTRAKELGAVVTVNNWNALAQFLPQTRKSAALLRRTGAAFGQDVSNVAFAGTTLGAFRGAGRTPTDRFQPEAPARLGTKSVDANTLIHTVALSRPDTLDVSDESLRAVAPHLWQSLETAVQEATGWTAERKLEIVRLAARGHELGAFQPLGRMRVGNWNSLVQFLPQTDESLAVLRRLALAMALAESSISFAGRSVPLVPPIAPRKTPGPLGTDSLEPAAIQARLHAFEGLDGLSDESLQSIQTFWPNPLNWPFDAGKVSVDAQLSRLRAYERGAELGVLTASQITSYIGARTTPEFWSNSEGGELVINIALRANLYPSRLLSLATPAGPLGVVAGFREAMHRVQSRALGAGAPLPSRDEQVRYDLPEGPLGTEENLVNNLLVQQDPKFGTISDQAIRTQVGLDMNWLKTWSARGQSSAILKVMARSTELAFGQSSYAQQFLDNGIPPQACDDESLISLARTAIALGRSLSEVRFQAPQSGAETLAQHPTIEKRLIPKAKSEAEIEKRFALLDASKSASPSARRAAMLELVRGSDDFEMVPVERLFREALELSASGKLAPVSMSGLKSDDQVKLVKEVFDALPHLGAVAVFLGLYTKLDAETVEAGLRAAGFDEPKAKTWGSVAGQLGTMSAEQKAFVLKPVLEEMPSDFHALPLRISLAANSLSKSDLEAGFLTMGQTDLYGYLSGILEAAANTPEGSAEREAVHDFINLLVKRGDIDPEEVREFVRPETLAVLLPNADAELDHAVEAYVQAGLDKKPARVADLRAVIEANAQFGDPNALASKALGRLYQADLTRVLPLAEADAELGGVGAALFEPKARYPEGTETVAVGGLEIKVNDRKDKDKAAIPKQKNADLVMTDTTLGNIRRIAAAWRLAHPVLLEGPTSSGKTSAIRYMAYKTGSPYRRINLSYYTEVEDLLGRYVGGEKQYGRAALEAKNKDELHAIGAEYGVADGASDQEVIDQVLKAQGEPRWVDGPVVRAMKNGEVLLLDEMNLARPEVLERLNSLFDDDGNIVLTEHANEVIAPDENFRLFATMNPASYSGRARLSDAMRSRWTNVFAHGLTQADLSKVIKTLYKDQIPLEEMAKLIAIHDNLSRAADAGEVGRSSGGIAFTLRNLFKACDRFTRYSGGELDNAAIMRREVEELYMGGLFDEDDIAHVKDLLDTTMPYDGPSFYGDLELDEDKDAFTIGDVTISKLGIDHPLTPGDSSRLVMTDRTKQVLYRLAKALDMGENVGLMGERASGKTAMAKMFAGLRGQPYRRQNLHGSTDGMQLIGGYDNTGWRDGLLLEASRPDGVPGVFVGDEFNLASPALLERLNSVLDDERKLVLAERAPPEEVRLHPEFRFIAAMNPPTAAYAGRAKLSPAMQNRFTMIWVPDLDDPEEQKEILAVAAKKMDVQDVLVETLVELQGKIRKAYEDDVLGSELREKDKPVYSIRSLFKALERVADTQGEMGPATAYLMAVESIYASSAQLSDNEAIMAMAKEVAA